MRLTFFFSFILLALTAFTQTQKETEDWIVSKIYKYKDPYYSSTSSLPIKLRMKVSEESFTANITSVSFKNCQLIIVENIEGKRSRDFSMENFTKTLTYEIPFSQLSRLEYGKSPHSLTIYTENANITRILKDQTYAPNSETTYEESAYLHINLDTENDLFKRLEKAFMYLKENFCNKSRPKEIF